MREKLDKQTKKCPFVQKEQKDTDSKVLADCIERKCACWSVEMGGCGLKTQR